MTIKELYQRCAEEIKNGEADSEVIVCVNGNEFYRLECGFSSPIYNDTIIYDSLVDFGLNEDDVKVLN